MLCRDKLDANVQSCVECYTSDFVVVRRKHLHFSSSSRTRTPAEEEEERLRILDVTPQQEFEVDDVPEEEYDHVSNIFLLGSSQSLFQMRFSAYSYLSLVGKWYPLLKMFLLQSCQLLRDPRDAKSAGSSKLRHWRRSLNAVAREQLSVPNSLGGSLRSLESLNVLPRSSSASSMLDLMGGTFRIGSSMSINISIDMDDEDAKTVCGQDDEVDGRGMSSGVGGLLFYCAFPHACSFPRNSSGFRISSSFSGLHPDQQWLPHQEPEPLRHCLIHGQQTPVRLARGHEHAASPQKLQEEAFFRSSSISPLTLRQSFLSHPI